MPQTIKIDKLTVYLCFIINLSIFTWLRITGNGSLCCQFAQMDAAIFIDRRLLYKWNAIPFFPSFFLSIYLYFFILYITFDWTRNRMYSFLFLLQFTFFLLVHSSAMPYIYIYWFRWFRISFQSVFYFI